MNRAELNRTVWMELQKEARVKVAGDYDMCVRQWREESCKLVTERTRVHGEATEDYKNLSDDEMLHVLVHVRTGNLPERKFPNGAVPATADQRKKIRYLSLQCALHYYTWLNVEIANEDTGEIYTPSQLKAEANRQFKKGKLEKALLHTLHTKWIHPTIHEWLWESGLRYQLRMPKNMEYLKWEDLKQEEASVLIQRFSKMHNAVITRYDTSAQDNGYKNN